MGYRDYIDCRKYALSRLAARRSDTIRPPDEAAGVRHCLYGFDYVDPVAKRSPGAATAYMTVKAGERGGEEGYGVKQRG